MGNANIRQQQDPRTYLQDDLTKTYLQNDLPRFINPIRIGNSKFMKTYSTTVDGVAVIVKIYIKPYEEDVQLAAKKLTNIWKILSPLKYPNLLPYQLWIRSPNKYPKLNATPIYLIRQHLHLNLYDRLSTRPFLNDLEKLFLIFQLFKCVETCHKLGVMHGDLKPENIICTTWNWIVLTDFGSSFKPTLIPDEDPTDFQYYFDSMNRNRCYIAPERFYRKEYITNKKKNNINESSTLSELNDLEDDYIQSSSKSPIVILTSAMDIFSLGCVLAEIWLNGEPLIDLPEMLKYVGEKNINNLSQIENTKDKLNRIQNVVIKEIIIHMTQKDPKNRLSVLHYRTFLEGKYSLKELESITYEQLMLPLSPLATSPKNSSTLKSNAVIFPAYFEDFLHPLYMHLHWKGVTPDDRLSILCDSYKSIIKYITNEDDDKGVIFFSTCMKDASNPSEDNTITLESLENEINQNSNINIAKNILTRLKPESIHSLRHRSHNDEGKLAYRKLYTEIIKNNGITLSSSSSSENSSPRKLPLQQDDNFNILPPTPPKTPSSNTNEIPYNNDGNVNNTSSLSSLSLDELMSRCNKLINNNDSNPIMEEIGNSIELIESSLHYSRGVDSTSNQESFFDYDFSQFHSRKAYPGLIFIIHLITSNFRHLKFPHSKIISIMMLIRLGQRSTDEMILQRILPILLLAVDDPSTFVRSISIKALVQLLSIIQTITAFESNIFPLYIFPSLNRLTKGI